jgi:hypothetical protein
MSDGLALTPDDVAEDRGWPGLFEEEESEGNDG